ncbi:MAG TPA: winged helix-turn-helix transcriptional regulator [Methylomirabilota bacterium]|nr:winged helix-turn-helix transcriptional regulator [Methylomirabilota bacterium]
MPTTRYPQFCALARACELLGERWTLLIVRELLLGPKRFSDLRERLDGISPSVLTERLGRAEELELVRRAVLPPPAASTVYELTEHGEALRPAVYELIRWGGRFLHPARKRERIEPEWMRLALDALARRGPSPRRAFLLRVREGRKEVVLHVAGGPGGTTVSTGAGPSDAALGVSVQTLLGLVGGSLPLQQALETGAIEASGDVTALADLPRLFDVERTRATTSKRAGNRKETQA